MTAAPSATPKLRPNRVAAGPLARRPSIESPDVALGDEYYADDDGGAFWKVTLDATGAKAWTRVAGSAALFGGSGKLVAGVATVTDVPLAPDSRILLQRTGGVGGAVGVLDVTSREIGARGSFKVESRDATARVESSDGATFDYLVLT